MPAWNAARFIGPAIESVLAQTHANWELLIVDDGSTDGTGDVARRFADPRIRVLRTENRGPSAARNLAISEARGEFVAFLDADDAWMPRKLEAQFEAFARESEAALVYCACVRLDENSRRLPSHRLPLGRLPTGRCLDRILVRNDILTPSVMVRRDALAKAGGFPEDVRGGEDWHVWRRVALFGRFVYVPRRLACVRYAAGTLTGRREAMDLDVGRVIDRAFSDPEVRRRFTPRRLARLRARAEAARLYDAGGRALRAGDAAAARSSLLTSMRSAFYDVRQPLMLAGSLVLMLPLVSRRVMLRALRK